MKVFVTGATGFVGQEILRQLHKAYSVRILVRRLDSPVVGRLQREFSLELHPGDVLQPDSLSQGLNGTDAVIHLVGIISQVGQSTFENVHVLGTRHVLLAAKQAGVRFAHMSALGTRPNAASLYHQTKWAAEEEVRHSGLNYTIFRPSLIFGPQDDFVNLFAKLSRFSPVIPIIGNGQARFQPVAVEVVARAFVASLTEPGADSQTLELCGPETLSFDEIIDQILEVAGHNRLKLHIPVSLARLKAGILEWIFPKVLGRAPPLNRDQILMLQEGNVGDNSKATELFGLPSIRFRDGINKYLAKRYTSMP